MVCSHKGGGSSSLNAPVLQLAFDRFRDKVEIEEGKLYLGSFPSPFSSFCGGQIHAQAVFDAVK